MHLSDGPLYISRIRLENIRCFQHFEIVVPQRGQSLLLLGDNGDGKSTVMRSIAMGVCDESSAAALFRELPGEYVRRESAAERSDVGTIEIDFDSEGGESYRIATQIVSLETFERVSQYERKERKSTLHKLRSGKIVSTVDQDTFPWHRIFVSGYGAGSRTNGSQDFQHYLAVDAVYSLFRYDAPLQNPELVIRRFVEAARETAKEHKEKSKRAKAMLGAITHLLGKALNLKDGEHVHLAKNGVRLVGPSNCETELGEAGDGYRATVTWLLDLLAWWLLYADSDDPAELDQISGVVLIDEVEQHLHPKWQLRVMQMLSQCFPKIQFIASSHSPLVASGTDGAAVYQLRNGKPVAEEPSGWLAEHVYEFMGLESSRPQHVRELLAEYEALDEIRLAGKLSEQQKKRLSEIDAKLGTLPSTDPVVLSKKLANLARAVKEQGEASNEKR